MATVPRLLTYQEWLRMPPVEDGTDEVVKGELRFMPPNYDPHAAIIQLLIEAFVGQVDLKKVQILGSNFGLMISQEPLTCRSPDLALYWRDKIVVQDGLYRAAIRRGSPACRSPFRRSGRSESLICNLLL